MAISKRSEITVCPQCGEDWSTLLGESRGGFESCPRCGSSVGREGFDPLKPQKPNVSAMRISRQSRMIVRLGVWGIALVSLLGGGIFIYAGWINSLGLDLFQLWVSRVGGVLLIIQGLFYVYLPFRNDNPGKILSFESKK